MKPTTDRPAATWRRRLLWFSALWLAGLAATAAVAYALRALLLAAGG